jgi:hypothetical protein
MQHYSIDATRTTEDFQHSLSARLQISLNVSKAVIGYNACRESLMKPGEDLIHQGLIDLAAGEESIPALLVAIGAPRLRRLGKIDPEGFSLAVERVIEENN